MRMPKETLSPGNQGAFQHLLKRIAEFGSTLPSDISKLKWRLIITTSRDYLRGDKDDTIYVASCNLHHSVSKEHPENTVYLHPYFFELPELEQLKILYFFLVGKFIKRIDDVDEAMRDAEMFIDYCRISSQKK